MTALLATVLVASLAGSFHCVGMCGPFVAFYAGGDAARGARRLLSHATYSAGRLAAYAALGLAAGAIGAALDLAGSLAGIQQVAAVAGGVVMITWGVLALLQLRGLRVLPRIVHHLPQTLPPQVRTSRPVKRLRAGFPTCRAAP